MRPALESAAPTAENIGFRTLLFQVWNEIAVVVANAASSQLDMDRIHPWIRVDWFGLDWVGIFTELYELDWTGLDWVG